jgi:hypothetical protein
MKKGLIEAFFFLQSDTDSLRYFSYFLWLKPLLSEA